MTDDVSGDEVLATAVLAERLLQVIDEGRRVATYKLALLMALIDASATNSDEHGRAPKELHTRLIARHVLGLYLPHARAYLGSGQAEPVTLRQITNRSSAVMNAVLRLHLVAENGGHRSLAAVELHYPQEFAACLDEVERTFARFPILRLQVVGAEYRPFLYDVDWGESVSLRALHADGGGMVRFRPGAGDQLLRLAPLLRPLIELHWVRMVAALNGLDVEGERLRDHLFGPTRATFPPRLRAGLRELQDDRCFYCDQRLTTRADIDHFIPWSRWPNDTIENLVVADACNGHKSDHLAASDHARRWADRLHHHRADLEQIASSATWSSDAIRTVAIGRSTYFHLPLGTPLWLVAGTFTDEDPHQIASAL